MLSLTLHNQALVSFMYLVKDLTSQRPLYDDPASSQDKALYSDSSDLTQMYSFASPLD